MSKKVNGVGRLKKRFGNPCIIETIKYGEYTVSTKKLFLKYL